MRPQCSTYLTPVAVWLLCAACTRAEDKSAPEQLHQSPDGRFSLRIKPEGTPLLGAHYELRRGEKILWSGARRYALDPVFVANNGAVVGTAPHFLGFQYIILNERGKELLNEPVQQTIGVEDSIDPLPIDVVAQSETDTAIFLIHHSLCSSVLRVYQLSTGELMNGHFTETIVQRDRAYIVDFWPVSGTPLLLCQWVIFQAWQPQNECSAYFTLLDESQRVVWSLELPNNYLSLPARDMFGRQLNVPMIRKFLENRPEILRLREPKKFALNPLSRKEPQIYSVQKKDGAWTVELVSEQR